MQRADDEFGIEAGMEGSRKTANSMTTAQTIVAGRRSSLLAGRSFAQRMTTFLQPAVLSFSCRFIPCFGRQSPHRVGSRLGLRWPASATLRLPSNR